MVEVFKTNVIDQNPANILINHIQNIFPGYSANFDLDDCDNILRVECNTDSIQILQLVDFLKSFGYTAEILPDEAELLKGDPV